MKRIGILLLLALVLSCGREPYGWSDLKRHIRKEFPDAEYLSVDDFEKKIAKECFLVDVRYEEEYALSHIRGAVNIRKAAAVASAFRKSGKDSLVLYCSVGYRSADMAQKVQSLVEGRVYNLEGSIFEWANAGKPLYRGEEQVAVVHPFDAHWGQLLKKKYRAELPASP